MGPLDGLKILEIAGIGPGPFAAMLLSDMGAVAYVGVPIPDARGKAVGVLAVLGMGLCWLAVTTFLPALLITTERWMHRS